MITRRKRTETLIESDPALAAELASTIKSAVEVIEVVPPRQGLVMSQVRESARNSRFYLGEALMTECRVRAGDVEGLGVVLGSNDDLARSLAVIDAAYVLGSACPVLEHVDRRIELAATELMRRRQIEARKTMTSRVSFDTMGGQDMSAQAVVK